MNEIWATKLWPRRTSPPPASRSHPPSVPAAQLAHPAVVVLRRPQHHLELHLLDRLEGLDAADAAAGGRQDAPVVGDARRGADSRRRQSDVGLLN